MCQSAAEGGRRCAAHTRPGFHRALSVFGRESDASKRARLVEEHADAIIEHAVTPKGAGEVKAAIENIESVYAANPSRTAAEETGRSEYVAALKTAQMRASLRSTLEHAARTTHSLARTGAPAPELTECETGAMTRETDRAQIEARIRRTPGSADVPVMRYGTGRGKTTDAPIPADAVVLNSAEALNQRWFESAALTLAEGRYVTPRSGGATAESPVHLEVSAATVVTREHGEQLVARVSNRLLKAAPTTCGKPGHSASMSRTPVQGSAFTDCACDAACTHCGAGEGASCTTNDGGGMSGGGYTAKSHAKRVKASGRIQGLVDGSRSRCDFGDHQWSVNSEGTSATCTGTCGRTEPVHDSWRRLNRLVGSGSTQG